MNKYLSLVLILLGIALIAYNVTMLNFESPFSGDSLIALIGIVAALCAILLVLIFNSSKKIQKKLEED